MDLISTRKPVALAEIVFPSGTVLRAGTDLVKAGPVFWEPLLIGDGFVTCPGNYCGTDVEVATAEFMLADRPLSLTGGGMLSALLADEHLVGSSVTLYLWERSLSDFGTDACVRFSGVVQAYSVRTDGIAVAAAQRRDWNRSVMTRRVTRDEYRQASEDVVGARLGVILGRVTGLPTRQPFPTEYGAPQNGREHFAGGRRVAKSLTVDVGRGAGTKAKIVVAGHRMQQLGSFSPNYGASLFYKGDDGLMQLLELSSGDVFNTDTEAGFYIGDNALRAWYPLGPSDIDAANTTAENPRGILDPNDETTWAHLDFAAGQSTLAPVFPSPPSDIGTPLASVFWVLYRTAPGVGLSVNIGPAFLGPLFTAPASTTPTVYSYTVAVPFVPSPTGSVKFSIASGSADVIACGWALKWAPPESLLKTVKETKLVPLMRPPSTVPPWDKGVGPFVKREIDTSVTEVIGRFFANGAGWPDDVAGTYTGTPTTRPVVERFPDLAHLVLDQLAGGEFVETGGDLGDFVAARAKLMTWNGREMVGGFTASDNVDVRTLLGYLMAASASQILFDEFSDTWRFIPWELDPAVTYARAISKFDLLDPAAGIELEQAPDTDIIVAASVRYGYDADDDALLHESSVTGAPDIEGSVAGQYFRNIRDERIEFVASQSDRIDFRRGTFLPTVTGAATYAASLTPLAYSDPMTAAQDVATALNAADPTACNYQVGYGGRIVAGYNDTVDFPNSGVWAAVIPPGDYTMPDLAAAVQTAMNSAGGPGGFTVTYNRTTRKFAITHATLFPVLYASLGANAARSILPVLGFDNGWRATGNVVLGGTGGTITGTYEREEERFYIASTNTWLDILYRTGASGSAAATVRACGEPLGFDIRNDLAGLNDTSWLAPCPKGVRESVLSLAAALYGAKQELPIEGRAIYDGHTARERRNRAVELQAREQPRVRFSVHNHFGLRRGDVFVFADDVNDVRAYSVPGSGGDWTTGRFRVLELHPAFGSSFHNEVVAVDMARR